MGRYFILGGDDMSVTRNIKMTISYDGTNYAGFQSQRRTNLPTIQEVLENALEKITAHPVRINASGRTDAGVHAMEQVVNFKTDGSIPTFKIPVALNSILPKDIVVKKAVEVDASFHARFSAVAKTYLYQIYNHNIRPAIGHQFFFHYPFPLDIKAMNEAAEYLTGEHDFASFCAAGSGAKTTVRTIYKLSVKQYFHKIYIIVSANGFLYQMVRSITGTLLSIGSGKMALEKISELLAAKNRAATGQTAPPHGLFLARVYYELPKKFPDVEDFLDKGLLLL